MNVRTNLVLPQELVDAADRFAGPRGRSRYVAEALAAQVKRDRLREAVDASAGVWRDHPLFPSDTSVVDWVSDGWVSKDPWTDAD
jgi:hypothetical protein